MPPSKALPTSMPAWQHTPALFSTTPLQKALKLNQVAAVPKLKQNQTLIKVLTAGINPIDYKLAELPVATRLALGSPSTPGLDFAGRVWATKLPDSEGIRAGDLVFGKIETQGTLAGFAVATGTAGLVKAPANVELDWLAGMGVGALTAYQSIVPELEDQGEGSARGKSVFINGGSGGVGTFAVQIAKTIGCEHIVVSCSGANADFVKGLGATEVIDYRSVNVADAAKGFVTTKNNNRKFDLVVDNAGADFSIYYRSHEFLKEGGKYVLVGAGVSAKILVDVAQIMLWPGFLGGGQRSFKFLQVVSDRKQYERLAGWMAEGKLKVMIDSTFTMDRVPEAYERLKTGRARGKIVVRVSEDGRGDS